MTNEAFIVEHRNADVRALALGKVPTGVDLHYCLQQIEGCQIAERKIPSWARTAGIVYPVRLSLEQCSSEQTSLCKRRVIERLMPDGRHKMADITGGFGIDFYHMGQLFDEAHYVERNETLCEIARHNLPLLGMEKVHVHHQESEDFLDETGHFDFIYLDPGRRDSAGRKMVALSDCSPNVEALQEKLLARADTVLVKLSPMLDIQDALRRLSGVREVHVVSADGECKEVLLVMGRGQGEVTYHCVNLSARTQTFCTAERNAKPVVASQPERYLYEPNASILKAGVQDVLCQSFGIRKLHPFSHLFTSSHFIENFPGRSFLIEDCCSFAKKELKRMLADTGQCNLSVRNFPCSVAELRRRLKLREGGDCYLFATTLGDDSHALLRCKRL